MRGRKCGLRTPRIIFFLRRNKVHLIMVRGARGLQGLKPHGTKQHGVAAKTATYKATEKAGRDSLYLGRGGRLGENVAVRGAI